MRSRLTEHLASKAYVRAECIFQATFYRRIAGQVPLLQMRRVTVACLQGDAGDADFAYQACDGPSDCV